jgi:hypothetical protein
MHAGVDQRTQALTRPVKRASVVPLWAACADPVQRARSRIVDSHRSTAISNLAWRLLVVILNRSAPFFLSSARVDLPLLLKANAGFFMRISAISRRSGSALNGE